MDSDPLDLQLQQQVQFSQLLNQISTEICKTLDLDEVLEVACHLLGQALGCSRVSVLIRKTDEDDFLITRGEYRQGEIASQIGLQLPIANDPHLQALMERPGVLAIARLEEAAELGDQGQAIAAALGIQSMLAVATRYQGQVNGILGLHQCDRQREWLPWEEALVEGVAGQLAIAINQARLYDEMRHRAERESLLRLVTNQIRQTLNLPVIQQTVVQEVRKLLNTDRVVIYKFDQDWNGTVVVEDVIAPWCSVLGEIGQDDCFSGNYAHLYLGGRVRAINDVEKAGLNTCHVEFLQRLQVKANLIVPIVIGAQLWGLLIAHECRSTRRWQRWETDLLEQLANQVAIAIQQAELYARSQAQTQQIRTTLEQLQTAQMQLIQSEKLSLLGQVTAGVAHEVNNAMNFVHANLPHAQGYAASLFEALDRYRQAAPEAHDRLDAIDEDLDLDYLRRDFPLMLQSMRDGASRVREVVLALRRFAHLDEANHKAIDLHESIDSCLVILRHRLDMGVKVTKEYGALPPIHCRAGQLNQVFLNLINNAIDAGGDATQLTIRSWQVDPQTVCISFKDNGPGVPLELRERIFEPLFTTKDKTEARGLGLSICREIVVNGHRGRLQCISSPGEGAEFQVELPIKLA